MQTSIPLRTLVSRKEFLAAAKGRRYATPGLVLQARRNTPQDSQDPQDSLQDIGVGYTATKKTGNAVVRNRIKRRLRAAAREILADKAKPGFDYVLIGRAGTIDRPWQSLLDDLTLALQMVHQTRRRKGAAKASATKGSDTPGIPPKPGPETPKSKTPKPETQILGSREPKSKTRPQ